TWTVRFSVGGAPAYVTVNRQLPAIGAGFDTAWAAGWGLDASGQQRAATDHGNELWVALAEKAYAQLNESGGIGQDGTNNYHGIDFGRDQDALLQISGKPATVHSLSSASDLINAINSGYAITLDSKDHPGSNLITGNHSYMVTGYNPQTKMFQLFNPHGFFNHDSPLHTFQSPIVEVSWGAIMDNFVGWNSDLI